MRLIAILCLILASSSAHLNAQIISIQKPATGRNDTISGHKAWSIVHITSSGDSITSKPTILGQYTNDLIVTGFGFSIPSTAVVKGISAVIQKGATGLLNDITDSAVRLVVNGVITGSNLASANQWGVNDTVTYGSGTQTWGISWKTSNMNTSNFGIAISAKMGGLSVLPMAVIRNIQLKVYYTIALPVELTEFSVSQQQQAAVLNWTTETEINNNYFAIERSADGETFTELNRVAGNGNSTEQHNYIWQDDAPLNGTSYYRLKQVDYNGNEQYSDVQPFLFEPPAAATLKIYPNPVVRGQSLFVEINGGDENQNLAIYDVAGRLISLFKAEQKAVVNTAQLSSYAFVSLSGTDNRQALTKQVAVTEP